MPQCLSQRLDSWFKASSQDSLSVEHSRRAQQLSSYSSEREPPDAFWGMYWPIGGPSLCQPADSTAMPVACVWEARGREVMWYDSMAWRRPH
jgi:hypothetical protein